MPFGVHKGVPIRRCPHDYLRFLICNCELSEGLKAEIEAVLAGRPSEQPSQGVYRNGVFVPHWLGANE
jgi:hypothetical protein